MIRLPGHRRQDTLYALGYGAILLVWLSTENTTTLIVSLLGIGLSALLGWLAMLRWLGGRAFSRRQWLLGMILVGGMIGFGAVWMTIGLMIFKNGWHSHAYPDFAPELITDMLHRLLPWTIAGAMLGGAMGLLHLANASS
jgi:hypothetical protein